MVENLNRNSAWLYDLDIRDNLVSDIPFYIEFAEKQSGNILELGCGTGRVAIPLASRGFEVTGLDLSNEMLSVFENKIADKPQLLSKITLIHGNMANFTLKSKFKMIIAPFRVFQALTEDFNIENALERVTAHLEEDGIFIINVFNPIRDLMNEKDWPYSKRIQWSRRDDATGNYVTKSHWGNKIDVNDQVIYPNFEYKIQYSNGKTEVIVDNLKFKYYYNEQLRVLIKNAHMDLVEEYSWYDKSSNDGREIIFVCRKSKLD